MYAVAYGAGRFYIAWEDDDGRTAEIAALSPVQGATARASFQENFGEVAAIAVGNGGVWALWQELPPGDGAGADYHLTRWTTTLQGATTIDLPTVEGGQDVVVGGGKVWITDSDTGRLLIVDPPSAAGAG